MRKCCNCCCMDHRIRRVCREMCGSGTAGSDGETPYIGENGNWWIGEVDTGVSAQGEPGTDGISTNILGLQQQNMYSQNAEFTSVPFDIVIYNSLGSDIVYKGSVFTINEPGLYKFDWQVNCNNGDVSGGMDITLIVNEVNYATSSHAGNNGQICGSALLDVTTVPTYCSLVNTTGTPLYLSDVPVPANITIVKLS